MYVLGVNTGLNSSAVLMKDNEVIFAIQEERISRLKNQPGFPILSIKEALKKFNLKIEDIDMVAIGGKSSKVPESREDDLSKFDNRYDAIKKKWFGEDSGFPSIPEIWRKGIDRLTGKTAGKRSKVLEDFLKESGLLEKERRFEHHLCHAAASYYGLAPRKNDEKYLVFSMDGGGDGKTSAVYIGEKGKLTEIASSDSFSPACIYAHITYIMGFMPHEHEYKLMGLAPYAQQKYAEKAKAILSGFTGFDKKNPIVFTNSEKYPDVRNSCGEAKQQLVEDLFKAVLNLRFDTLSAGLQLMAEDIAINWIKAGVKQTGIKKVLLAGGFFMNVKANKLIAELPEVEFVSCFPSCGDESNAFGAAFLGYESLKKAGSPDVNFFTCCLGTNASDDIEKAMKEYGDKVSFRKSGNINEEVADMLIARKIIARCSGKMEFGARALGNRSIIASPDDLRIINTINAAIKKRDFWMPFAPAVMEDKLEEVVEVPDSVKELYSPYMMFTFQAKNEMWNKVIAGIHQADKTARAQTVNPRIYPEFYDIISKFHGKTGIPSVLNTSFNLHGFPIVTGACDAIDVYLNSELDVLIVDDYVITRK